MKEIRIVIVDDHPVVISGLRSVIEVNKDLKVVGEASNGLDAISKVEELEPDVLILDLMMPGMSGLDVAKHFAHNPISTKIIVMTMHINEAFVMDSLRAGVSGYIVKDSPKEILLQGIREVANGEVYLSPPLNKRAIELYIDRARGTKKNTSIDDPYQTLTAREREVFHLVLEGLKSKEIAERLTLSPRTVHVHRANILRKLGLSSTNELLHFGALRGFIPGQ